MVLRPGFVAKVKLNTRRPADANQVAILQASIQLNWSIVNGGAVTAAEIAYPKTIAAPLNFSVIARDVGVAAQRDCVIECPPDRQQFANNLELARRVSWLENNEFGKGHDFT